MAYGLVRVLDDEGQAVGPWAPRLSPDLLRAMLRNMALTRAFDDRMFRAQRQGKTSFYMKCTGEEAVAVANASEYALGASVWAGDRDEGERVALRLRGGAAFVNAMVKSDPRLPFGGVGVSGWGRELGREGMRSFTVTRSVWVE
jgi:TPP-dependent pyruvate/acetoin dehydrogenase alpha subunit